LVQVIISGAKVASERDFHRQLVSQLEFGDHYGWNLAALRDRLLADVPRPVLLVWQDAAESRRLLGSDLFDRLVAVLDEAQKQDVEFGWTDRFTYTLA
jgi:ribonuclease inhibitor